MRLSMKQPDRVPNRAGLTVESAVAVSSAGRNNMPAFREAYSIDELCDVATFVVERLAAE
jgi:hypothetical protein